MLVKLKKEVRIIDIQQEAALVYMRVHCHTDDGFDGSGMDGSSKLRSSDPPRQKEIGKPPKQLDDE